MPRSDAVNDEAVLAYLRSSGDDHLLVVANLGPNPIDGIVLDLMAGPLAGVTTASDLFGTPVEAPDIDAAGGFSGYAPVVELPPMPPWSSISATTAQW